MADRSLNEESPEEVKTLLGQWGLGKHAEVFAELGVDAVSDLAFVQDSDLDEQQIPKVAKRKMQAMLDTWREQSVANKAKKKETTHSLEQHQQPARTITPSIVMLSDDIMHLVMASVDIESAVATPRASPVRLWTYQSCCGYCPPE